MRELVDFNSRGDFDKFMSKVENSYFSGIATVSKSPYVNELPEYPPKPYSGFPDSRRSARILRRGQSESDGEGGQYRDSSESPTNKSQRFFDEFVDTVK